MKAMRFILAILILFLLCVPFASASEPYTGYNYDAWGESVSTPNAYTVKTVLKAGDIGTKSFLSPMDLTVFGDKLYILDSGNSRIVVTDSSYRFDREIQIKNEKGEIQLFNGASGIFVNENYLLVADTENAKILMADHTGKLLQVYSEPQKGTLPSGVTYKPKKVLMDDLSNLYVLSDGCYMGALVFKKDGSYQGYFGANTVQLSVSQLIKRFWRLFMTDAQKAYTAQYVPIEYQSFDIDKKGFIYTCGLRDSSVGTSVDEIKKLNALGKNILLSGTGSEVRQKNNYGDIEQQWENGVLVDSKLTDIDVSSDEFIQALDTKRGRVFIYDQDNNLLTIFGGIGTQTGLFVSPVALESIGDDVLVLDKVTGQIIVFEPNQFGKLIRQATLEQKKGQFDKALGTWKQVLKYNANSEIANSGVGRMLIQMEDYRGAMTYLKYGQDRAAYSKAYRFYRAELMTAYFPLIAVLIVLLASYALARPRLKALYYEKTGRQPRVKTLYVSQTLTHPLNFFDDLFYNRSKRAFIGSWVMVGLLILVTVIERQATGFIFNTNKLADFNIAFILFRSFGLMLLLTLSNWMVSTMLWGEGTVKQVWMGNGYALMPYILAQFISVILSNLLTKEEQSVISLVMSIGLLYTLFLFFTAVRVIHRYSVARTVFACLLIVLISMLILFLFVLVLSLLQQFYVFIMSITKEITFRL